MSSNYPPGVTGNEPAITGEIQYDAHAPFWVGEDPENDGRYVVWFADSEDLFFTGGEDGGWTNERHAQNFADRLNGRYGLRHEIPGRHGFCQVCHDLHGEPPGVSS